MYLSLRQSRLYAVAAIGIMAAIVFLGIQIGSASADQDPVSCEDTGGSISLAAFRSDGVTNIGIGTVTDGELIKYKATLGPGPAGTCAYEGGTWTITTPDGVVHPLGAVPRIGGTGAASFSS